MTTAIGNPIQEYMDLHFAYEDAKDEVARLKILKDEKEEQALKHLIDLGARRMTTERGTVYIQKTTRISLKDGPDGSKDHAHAVMREHGLDILIKDNVNGNSLSKWYREEIKAGETVPEPLMAIFNVNEQRNVNVRSD